MTGDVEDSVGAASPGPAPFVRQRMTLLRDMRATIQAELALPRRSVRLLQMRRCAEFCATRTDALIVRMRTTRCGVLSCQLREAEDLRAYFRIVASCIDAMIGSKPGPAQAPEHRRAFSGSHKLKAEERAISEETVLMVSSEKRSARGQVRSDTMKEHEVASN